MELYGVHTHSKYGTENNSFEKELTHTAKKKKRRRRTYTYTDKAGFVLVSREMKNGAVSFPSLQRPVIGPHVWLELRAGRRRGTSE